VLGVGDEKKAVRKKATGTREHIVAYLTEGEVYDKDGMASPRLAAAVGYPGSSIAFAQLLSGMERAGIIQREVRGKRTYRITLGDVDGFGPVPRARAASAGAARPARPASSAGPAGGADFDYDELARRLLVQVVRVLAARPGMDPRQSGSGALGEPVTDLEHELASAWTKHGRLAEENIRLREQLRAAQQSIALARDHVRRLPLAAELDDSEVMVLQRLLSAGGGGTGRQSQGEGRADRGRGIAERR
jgi:hypothetical protein